jgi:hypothetical protein
MRKILLLLPLLLLVNGCAALGKLNQVLTSQKNPIVLAGVTLAVSAAVGSGTDAKTKAAEIKSIAQAVLADASTPAATVALLESALNAKIQSVAKNPAEAAAFMILSSTLETYLNTYIQSNPAGAITADTLVDIQGVANAVIQATSFYGV